MGERLYGGESVAFDLTLGNVSFEMSKKMTIATREHFARKNRSRYDPGGLSDATARERKAG
jgi:hypothetical protein